MFIRFAWIKYITDWFRSGPGFFAAINTSKRGDWSRKYTAGRQYPLTHTCKLFIDVPTIPGYIFKCSDYNHTYECSSTCCADPGGGGSCNGTLCNVVLVDLAPGVANVALLMAR